MVWGTNRAVAARVLCIHYQIARVRGEHLWQQGRDMCYQIKHECMDTVYTCTGEHVCCCLGGAKNEYRHVVIVVIMGINFIAFWTEWYCVGKCHTLLIKSAPVN